MSAREPNLAVVENRVFNLEEITRTLANAQLSQTQVNKNLELTISLLQEDQKRYHDDDKPKLSTLWENRSQIKGGYLMLAMLGAMIVGAATVAGVTYEVIQRIK